MALGRNYRFTVLNSCGQTLASGAIVIKARRWYFDSSGVQTWEGSEATLDTSGSTLATGSYFNGTAQDNTAPTRPYLGGTFKISITAPTSANGPITVWLQRSTDGGTSWPDNGLGTVAKVFAATAATTYTDEVEL
jgi:hypothetical protein